MVEQEQKSGCAEDGRMYPHGSKLCKEIFWDVYCLKCVDGQWEASFG